MEAETRACGRGATPAALVVHHAFQPGVRRFDVEMPGGRLSVAFDRAAENPFFRNIRLSGEARRVFSGTIDTDNL